MRLDRIIGRSKTPKFLVLLIAVLLLVGWNAEPALAQNLYAIATVDAPSANENFLGGYAQWKTPTQYTTVDGGFTSQVIWVTTQNQQYRWVEVGLTKGWKGDDSIWTMYWAEYTPTYNEYKVTSVTPGSTGSLHHYQVQYDAYNTWGAYIYYTKVGTSTQSAGTLAVDVGAEVTSSQNTLTTTYPEYMQVLKAGTWKYWKDVGSISEYDDSPFVWEWRDTGTYKLGKTYKN